MGKNKLKVLAIGDSHVRVFKNPLFKLWLSKVALYVTYVPGASAIGILNSKSQTNAREIFLKAIAANNYDYIIVNLGEVDTCIAIWKVADQTGAQLNIVFERAIKNYLAFLAHIKQSTKVIVLSATLPTIKEYKNHGSMVHNVRASMDIHWRDRSELTFDFNARIALWCRQNEIHYLDSSNAAVGPDGFVRRSWRKLLDRDHHYAPLPYGLWLKRQLTALFNEQT